MNEQEFKIRMLQAEEEASIKKLARIFLETPREQEELEVLITEMDKLSLTVEQAIDMHEEIANQADTEKAGKFLDILNKNIREEVKKRIKETQIEEAKNRG